MHKSIKQQNKTKQNQNLRKFIWEKKLHSTKTMWNLFCWAIIWFKCAAISQPVGGRVRQGWGSRRRRGRPFGSWSVRGISIFDLSSSVAVSQAHFLCCCLSAWAATTTATATTVTTTSNERATTVASFVYRRRLFCFCFSFSFCFDLCWAPDNANDNSALSASSAERLSTFSDNQQEEQAQSQALAQQISDMQLPGQLCNWQRQI